MNITSEKDGRIRISGIDRVLAYCLHDLPEILQYREQPGIRERFFQDLVAADDAVNRDWHETVDPDLHHLLETSVATVTRDLTGLDGETLEFAGEHLTAWMSALNQARLVLGELHQVTENDMARTELDVSQPRDKALAQIHVLGYLLQSLVEQAENP